jgi:hypothetical protein
MVHNSIIVEAIYLSLLPMTISFESSPEGDYKKK